MTPFAPARKVPSGPRLGAIDALLVACVVVAVWTQTPVGAVLARVAHRAGLDVAVPELTASFAVESLWEIVPPSITHVRPDGLDITWPVADGARVTSTFGMRVHPVFGDLRFHNGVDLAVPIGTPVLSAREGVVTRVTEDERSGRYVVIDHPGGVRTAYCHLSEVDVVEGQSVTRGQVFARSGNSGRSTGPHLHFVVRVDGRAIDPLTFAAPVATAALSDS